MVQSSEASGAAPRGPWCYLVPGALALAYALAHLSWYRDTPLGQGPVVDELDNLEFAEAIARGALPAEPFYRAAGYPLLLAALRGCGLPTSALFGAALTLGAIAHAINAGLASRIAATWFGRRGAWSAGLLFALNPVLLHYSTQALDAVPALMFFLIGLCLIAPILGPRAANSKGALWRWIVASLAWAGATLCRPNYFIVWCALVAIAGWIAWRHRTIRVAAGALAGTILFLALAGWQYRVSGVFGFLPWQGAYNLWAANAPMAHGRYYVQQTVLPVAVANQNAARAESIYLFRQEVGRAPADFRELNAHWRQRFIARVTQHPLEWSAQLGRKAYALLNNWEQYNNKTYAFHQARSPWLRWNPLGWGILLVLGVAGFARLRAETPAAAGALVVVVVTCALSILLFFVSARFRLPLVGVLTILAGGALAAPGFWRAWSRRHQLLLAAALIVAAATTFSRFDDVRSEATFLVDHTLIAQSALRQEDYRSAWTEANHALTLQPTHRDALHVAVIAYFNQLVREGSGFEPESRWVDACSRLLATQEPGIRELRAVATLAWWRAGRRADALAEWRNLGGTASAVAARLLVGDRSVTLDDLARAPAPLWREPLVRLAAARLGIPPPPGVKLADPERARVVIDRLFGR